MSDDELVTFASEFREGILDGDVPALMCFAVCAPLVTLLSLYGVEADMVVGDLGWINHTWLRLRDGRVLDPTADQFNDCDGYEKLPPVYLGPPTAIHTRKLSANPRTPTDA